MTLLWVKNGKRCDELLSYTYFGQFKRKETKGSFKNEERSIQGLKHSFLCNLWAWSKLF